MEKVSNLPVVSNTHDSAGQSHLYITEAPTWPTALRLRENKQVGPSLEPNSLT